MTAGTQDFLKKNLPAWVTFANFALLLSFVWYQAKWQQNVDTKIEKFENHLNDIEIHMPYQKKIQFFVPRTELEIQLINITQTLSEIKEDIKNLEKK